MIESAKSITNLHGVGTRKNKIAIKCVQTFSLDGTHFPCPTLSAVGQSGVMVEERILELNAEKKILPVGCTSQDGSLEARDGARQLRLVDERYGNLE